MRRRPATNTPLRSIPALRRHVAFTGVASVTITICVVVQALAFAAALAVGIGRSDWDAAVTPALVAGGAVIVRGALGWLAEIRGRHVGSAVMVQLRDRLVRAALAGAPIDRGEQLSGNLATLAVHGGAAVERWAGRAVLQRSLAVATPLVALVTIVVVDPLSAALLAPTIPLLILFLVLAGSDARRVASERLAALTLLGGHMLDVVRGLPILRSFGRAHVQVTELETVGEAYRRGTVATLRSAFASSFVLEFMAMLGTALVAVVAGVRLVHGSMAFEPAMAVLLLAPEIYSPLRNLGAEYHAAADARATLERIWMAGEVGEVIPAGRPGSGSPDPAREEIVVCNVTVRPAGAERETLSPTSLVVTPGATIVLVGPSGAGKTTLLRLLLGLERPHRGEIICGGRPFDDIDLDAWRKQIAWLPQRPVVLPGSVAENLRIASPDAADLELWDALRITRLDGWVRSLPDGLDTPLGDGGVAISAGERRRLGLARVALRRPRLVLADEPTANLDSQTADEVLASLAGIVADCTAVIVTHEPEVLKLADEVVEMSLCEIAGTPVEEAA